MACSKQEAPISTSLQPEKAAKMYYTYLANGNYEEYVNAMLLPDSSAAYKDKIETIIAHHIDTQLKEKGKITDIQVYRSELAPNKLSARVFLLITHEHSPQEEILLTLLLKNKRWHIR